MRLAPLPSFWLLTFTRRAPERERAPSRSRRVPGKPWPRPQSLGPQTGTGTPKERLIAKPMMVRITTSINDKTISCGVPS
jgi:hypothetical protein